MAAYDIGTSQHHGQWQIERHRKFLRHAPAHHAHVLGVIEGVKYMGGDGCGTNAIKLAPPGRMAAGLCLTSLPESSAPRRAGDHTSHEARHYAFDIYGRLRRSRAHLPGLLGASASEAAIPSTRRGSSGSFCT